MRARILDFAHWIGSVDFNIMAPQIDGVIMKITQGNYMLDHLFNGFWGKAKQHSLLRGHYHYYDPTVKPIDQAMYYYNMSISADAGKPDFPPILDVEMAPFVADNIHATLEEISSLFNRLPMLYTSPSVWGSMGLLSWSKDFPLWVAQYPFKTKSISNIPLYDSMYPWLPMGFSEWKLWQCAGDLPGATYGGVGSIDYNLFNGTLNDLKLWLCKPITPPVAITVPVLPKATVLQNGLRIRTSPSVSSNILGSLSKGNIVQFAAYVQKCDDIWLAIVKDDVVGWSALYYKGTHLMSIL